MYGSNLMTIPHVPFHENTLFYSYETIEWDRPKSKQNLDAAVGNIKPDIVLKEYFRDPAHYADLLNAYFCHGEQKILPEELSKDDSVVAVVLDDTEEEESIERTSDLIRYRTHSTPDGDEIQEIFALENQFYLDRSMEPRVSLSRELIRLREIKKLEASHDETKEPDMFFSRLRREDFLPPVITLVVYYGDATWDSPTQAADLIEESHEEWITELERGRELNLFLAGTQELEFKNPDNIALFAAIRARYAKIPVVEKKKRIKEILAAAPKAARETYVRIWGTDVMRKALKEGGDNKMLPLLDRDYEEIETMRETLKSQDAALKDKDAALLRSARVLLQLGMSAPEIAETTHLALEEIEKL